jgi:pimeloyl-ACP methyl ester carboxylesterase
MKLVPANGVEIACEITGAGPPIVLCHGGEGDHRNFFNFAPLLAERLTVITFDQRDTGETRNGPASYTPADLGRDVGALIRALGYERAHVHGTSFGGLIAQQAAIRCPEAVDHLILSVTWAGPEPQVSDDFYKFALSSKTPEQTREYWKMFFSPAFAEAHADTVQALMGAVVTTRSTEQRQRRGGVSQGYNATPDLERLSCPTLVLQGGEDRIILPDCPRKIARIVPGARLAVLDGVGHAMSLEAPERVAAEVFRFVLGS